MDPKGSIQFESLKTAPDENIPTDEDIPGFEDNYYRVLISVWRISIGWFDLLITLGMLVSTILGGYANLGNLSDEMTRKLGLASFIVGSIVAASQILKTYASNAILEKKNQLQSLILEHQRNMRIRNSRLIDV